MIQDIFLRRLSYLFGTITLMGGFAIGMAMVVRYEPYGVPKSQKAEYLAILERQKNLKKAADDAKTTSKSPTIVCDDREHDFGMIDPHTTVKHTFKIENRGTSPLQLIAGDTSCKCTLSDLGTQWVAPGESTDVTLSFNSGSTREAYRQYAVVFTNDPQRPEFQLTVIGRVRHVFTSNQQELVFTDIEPGRVLDRKIQVYSQVWPFFELASISTETPGVSWEVEPMGADALGLVEATSGWNLKLSLTAPSQANYFTGILRISADPIEVDRSKVDAEVVHETTNPTEVAVSDAGSESEPLPVNERVLEIPLRGNSLKRLALFGPMLYKDEGIRMGVVPRGKELRILMKIRGELPRNLQVTKTEPAFIKATIEQTDRPHYPVLVISIPNDAPLAVFDGPTPGYLVIESDLLPSGSMKVPLHGVVSALAKDSVAATK